MKEPDDPGLFLVVTAVIMMLAMTGVCIYLIVTTGGNYP